jgi:tRNA(Phe) wybutosine-synthesizing methylase Tyw3
MKVEWVARDGSIFTKDEIVVIKIDATKSIRVQESIAFNVGDETAKYLVQLHNLYLQELKYV